MQRFAKLIFFCWNSVDFISWHKCRREGVIKMLYCLLDRCSVINYLDKGEKHQWIQFKHQLIMFRRIDCLAQPVTRHQQPPCQINMSVIYKQLCHYYWLEQCSLYTQHSITTDIQRKSEVPRKLLTTCLVTNKDVLPRHAVRRVELSCRRKLTL